MLAALDHLSPEHRKVIELVNIEQLSYAEAAKKIGVKIGTIKSRVNRAKELLIEIIENPNAFNADISPSNATERSLSAKAQVIVNGHDSKPKPQKLSRSKPAKFQPAKRKLEKDTSAIVKTTSKPKPRKGKYHLALEAALQHQGITENALNSEKLQKLLDIVCRRSEKQRRAVIGILEEKSLTEIASVEGTTVSNIIARLKAVIPKIENYKDAPKRKSIGITGGKKKRKREPRFNLRAILPAKEFSAVQAFANDQSIETLANANKVSERQIANVLERAVGRIDRFVKGGCKEEDLRPLKKKRKSRKRKIHNKALRQVFKEVGIQDNPTKSEQAAELINLALTRRQKEIVTLVLANKSLSEIARKFNISASSISATFKTAVGRLRSFQCSQEDGVVAESKPSQPIRKRKSNTPKFSRHHYRLRDVLIKQGVKGNPLMCPRFNELTSSRLTAIQQDTVRAVIAGSSFDDIAKDYRVGKQAVTARLKTVIDRLAYSIS